MAEDSDVAGAIIMDAHLSVWIARDGLFFNYKI